MSVKFRKIIFFKLNLLVIYLNYSIIVYNIFINILNVKYTIYKLIHSVSFSNVLIQILVFGIFKLIKFLNPYF